MFHNFVKNIQAFFKTFQIYHFLLHFHHNLAKISHIFQKYIKKNYHNFVNCKLFPKKFPKHTIITFFTILCKYKKKNGLQSVENKYTILLRNLNSIDSDGPKNQFVAVSVSKAFFSDNHCLLNVRQNTAELFLGPV